MPNGLGIIKTIDFIYVYHIYCLCSHLMTITNNICSLKIEYRIYSKTFKLNLKNKGVKKMKLSTLESVKSVAVGITTKGIDNLQDHKDLLTKLEFFKNFNDSLSKPLQGFVIGFSNAMLGNTIYYTINTNKQGYKNPKNITNSEIESLSIVNKNLFGYDYEKYQIDSVHINFQINENYNDQIGSSILNLMNQYRKGIKNLVLNFPITMFENLDFTLEKLDLINKIFLYQIETNKMVIGEHDQSLKASLIPLLEVFGYQAEKLTFAERNLNHKSYVEFTPAKFKVKKELRTLLKPFKEELKTFQNQIDELNQTFGYEKLDSTEGKADGNGKPKTYNYVYTIEHKNINDLDKQIAINKSNTNGNYKRLNVVEFNDLLHSNKIQLENPTKGNLDNVKFIQYKPKGKYNFNLYNICLPIGVSLTTINKLRNDNMKPSKNQDSLTPSNKHKNNVDNQNKTKSQSILNN